ncbi:16673_t:CDS:2 [Entrophospora sp. SA101]|nr:16673_t:CDS:2 [Entrophospora sp. SA101]
MICNSHSSSNTKTLSSQNYEQEKYTTETAKPSLINNINDINDDDIITQPSIQKLLDYWFLYFFGILIIALILRYLRKYKNGIINFFTNTSDDNNDEEKNNTNDSTL